MAAKKKGKPESKTSVKSYHQGIEAEKQEMKAYSDKMASNVRSMQGNVKSLRNEHKKFSKDLNAAASSMREEGIKNMSKKTTAFKKEIRDQVKEHKEAIAHMKDTVRYFTNEISRKKKDFQAYVRGPFTGYIKAFWG